MASSIHHAFFPHVVDSLFTNLDHEGLQVARPVCAQWREWADEQQFRHLVVRADLSVWSLRNGTEHLVVSMAPADRRFYELDHGTENLELSARLQRVFRKARVVDSLDDWAHWAYAKLAAWLEANLTRQPDVVRALFDLRTAATAFTYGHTRVYFASLGDEAEERADLGEFTGGVINIACTHNPSLLDQNLPRLLSQTGTENAPASTDEIVIVFHNGRSQLEGTPRLIVGRDECEVWISPTCHDFADAIADFVSRRWRKNPIVFVGLEACFDFIQWAQVWIALLQVRHNDAQIHAGCASITSLTHEEYKHQLGEDMYNLCTSRSVLS